MVRKKRETVVTRRYRCTGCGQRRTFEAKTEDLIAQQIASAGWKVDPMHKRTECPACWMLYEHSVVVGARGNS